MKNQAKFDCKTQLKPKTTSLTKRLASATVAAARKEIIRMVVRFFIIIQHLFSLSMAKRGAVFPNYLDLILSIFPAS